MPNKRSYQNLKPGPPAPSRFRLNEKMAAVLTGFFVRIAERAEAAVYVPRPLAFVLINSMNPGCLRGGSLDICNGIFNNGKQAIKPPTSIFPGRKKG